MPSPSSTQNPSGSTRSMAWVLQSPLLYGGVATVVVYAALPYLPFGRELAERYLCGHPLEYVTTALFLVGMAVVARKAGGLRRQRRALHQCQAALSSGGDAAVDATADANERREQRLLQVASRHPDTYVGRRVHDAAGYLARRPDGAGLEKHLKYLADSAADRLADSYSLVRTISWAVPILGFLGTVIGITLAIANVTPEQLESSLNQVTSGLAVAFDTTALALGLSLVLVLTTFFAERGESSLLADVEDWALTDLAAFERPVAAANPVLEAIESEAAAQLRTLMAEVVRGQVAVWESGLTKLQESWSTAMNAQQGRITESLDEATRETLADHRAQLTATREEYLSKVSTATEHLLELVQSGHQSVLAANGEARAAFEQVAQSLDETQSLHTTRLNEVIDRMDTATDRWADVHDRQHQAASEVLPELVRHGELLSGIVTQEAELTRLQQRLTDNLESLRQHDAFEETLQSLSAAVNLLTSRVKHKAA